MFPLAFVLILSLSEAVQVMQPESNQQKLQESIQPVQTESIQPTQPESIQKKLPESFQPAQPESIPKNLPESIQSTQPESILQKLEEMDVKQPEEMEHMQPIRSMVFIEYEINELRDIPNAVDCATINPDVFEFLYSPDAGSPNGVTRRGRAFDISAEMVSGRSIGRFESKITTADSFEREELNLAVNFDVDASYHAFSAAAKMSVSSDGKSSSKTMRKDKILRAYQCEVDTVGMFHTSPEDFARDSFKVAIEKFSASRLARDFGAFYAKKVELGGEYKESYSMEVSKKDSSQTFDTEINATYGSESNTISPHVKGGANVKVKGRKFNKNGRISRTISMKGGNVMELLGQTAPSTKDNGQNAKWAKTFTNDNLYAFQLELRPIWEVVEVINPQKGEELRKILRTKWGDEFRQGVQDDNAKSFIPEPVDRIKDNLRKNLAEQKCQQRRVKCESERANAVSWMNNWWYKISYTRHKNMRNAANDCKKEMDLIKQKLNSDMSLWDFKNWLTNLLNARLRSAGANWGVGGYNSVQSNRVNKDTYTAEKNIRRLFD